MLLPVASTMSWVENTLNLTNGYYMVASSEADPFEYLVPFPPGYTNAMKAQYTFDQITLFHAFHFNFQSTNTLLQSNFHYT